MSGRPIVVDSGTSDAPIGAVNNTGLAYSIFPVPGWHTAAAAAAIGTIFNGGVLTLPIQNTPIMCLPGTFINIAVKQVSGAATTSLTYRTQVYVNGFFQ